MGTKADEDKAEWVDAHNDTGGWVAGNEEDASKRKLGGTFSAHGERETLLADEGKASLAPLALTEEMRKEEHGKVGQFADAFNLYVTPMDRTLTAIGRTQDLLSAGAPALPKEMDRSERAAFHPLTDKTADHDEKAAYKDWRDARKATGHALQDHVGLTQELEGAATKWRAMKTVLTRRVKEKMKAADEKKLARLQAVHDFVVGAVGVIQDTVETIGTLGEAETLKAVRKATTNALPEPFSLKTIAGEIVFKLGDKEALDNSIAYLNAEIEALGIEREDLEIDAARTALAGITEQQLAGAGRLDDAASSMRENAAMFAQASGDGVDLRIVAMIAEAYQELRLFGEEANKQSKGLVKYLPAVAKAVDAHAAEIRADRAHANDLDNPRLVGEASDLRGAGIAAKVYGDLVREQLPSWKDKEAKWSGFFEANYGDDKAARKKALK